MIDINKYKDICELFNFDLLGDKIIVKESNNIYHQYLYEITPVSILSCSKDLCFKILTIYTEFLKGIDCNFKITIKNHKFNIEEYIKQSTASLSSDMKKNNIYKEYVKSLEQMIKKENIYYSSMYLCVVCDMDKIHLVEQNIYKMKSVGIDIVKLSNSQLEVLLYKSINKI